MPPSQSTTGIFMNRIAIAGVQVAGPGNDYRGQTYYTVMPNDPGQSLRVRVSVDPA
jgi:hypothetical protein